MESKIISLTILEHEIFLKPIKFGAGKIVVSGRYNSSHYWGAMGDTLQTFLLRIDSDYFANKLSSNNYQPCFKSTQKNIRETVKEILPWYKHLEFQKDLRRVINEMPHSSECLEFWFSSFVDDLDFYLIDDKFEREELKNDFESYFGEWWQMIGEKPSDEYVFYKKLHAELKSELIKV